MRHRMSGYKLGRDAEDRRALRRNLAVALFTHGQITTTIPKAKSVQPFVEKLITTARQNDLSARRRVIAELQDRIIVKNDKDDTAQRNKYGELVGGPRIVKKLFDEIAPKYADRAGGYTRIVKLARHRIGDGTDLCVLQLVGDEGKRPKPQNSRRREKADGRMEFAAEVRKAKAEKAEAPKA
ncbi:MAG: 50S ribosomal protein L17 [Planctomycetota bacterium]|nr:50S ribosomal protein L17 [Planctomycetota bacterium]